jgi:transposase-like protein
MPDKRKKYDREFLKGAARILKGAARILNETGEPIAPVARDLEFNEGTLGNWVNREREGPPRAGELTRDDLDELNAWRAEMPSCGWNAMF